MFSWPPAMTISASPNAMAWAARWVARKPEPHNTLSELAGVVIGRPA